MHKKTLNEYVSLIQSHIAEGNLKACIHTLEQAIIEYPDQNNFKINLGNIFTTLEDFESAEQIYLNLINTDLEKEAHNNLSVIYLKIGNTEKSIFHSKSALNLDINYKDAKYNLALAYYENKEFKKSINICKELNLDTDYKNKANELQYRGCQVSCDWIEYKTIVDLLSKNKTVVHPFLHVSYVMDEQSNFTNAKRWNKPIAKIEKNLSMVSGQKIKLGFLCGEIRNHPTFFLIKNLFKYMNKDLFSLFLFSYGHTQNEMNYIRDEFEEIIDITNSTDDKARDIIKSYKLNILIDLTTIISHNRNNIIDNFSANAVISYLAFPGTTANETYDFIITDEIVTPKKQQQYYSEKFLFMPESYQINDGSRIYSNESRNENNIPEDAFVLGCFNQSFKLDPVFFDIWLNIMDKCKSTVLWLLNDNEEMSSNIKNYASERIDTRRIIFADRVDYDQHIKRSGIIDLALDTRVYNGHTTSIEMIQCGVPLITCQGNHFASRVSASILTRVGMKELITYTNDEYENKILSLITNQKEYQNLCNKLEFNLINSSILNTEKFSKSFENMLINLFK